MGGDHHTIVLEEIGVEWGPTPFWFENIWLKIEDSKEVVINYWKKSVFRGQASFTFDSKIKLLKYILKHEVVRRLEMWKQN